MLDPRELVDPVFFSRLDNIELRAKSIVEGFMHGLHRSPYVGFSVEFASHREYVPGDDLRHIDWNVYARLDRFFIKLFREEEDLAVHILLDASASMDAGGGDGVPSKLVFAQRLAMAVAYVALVNQNRVCLSIVGARGRPAVQRLAPVRGRRGLERAGRFLLDHTHPSPGASVGGGPAGLNDALRQIAMTRVGAGVMIVLSDFLVREDISRGLNYLAAGSGPGVGGSFDTYCIQILSPGEMDPAAERERGLIGDLRLTDAETGAGAEVTISPALISRYRRRLDALCERLHRACAARRMTHLLVRSDTDIASMVLDQLRQRRLFG
ncbi:MAG: DUF58 domain-containing protein [Planctomycetes bacterium]|nr:DUF58 domain-containing protein [Planctomycetota bacterium]